MRELTRNEVEEVSGGIEVEALSEVQGTTTHQQALLRTRTGQLKEGTITSFTPGSSGNFGQFANFGGFGDDGRTSGYSGGFGLGAFSEAQYTEAQYHGEGFEDLDGKESLETLCLERDNSGADLLCARAIAELQNENSSLKGELRNEREETEIGVDSFNFSCNQAETQLSAEYAKLLSDAYDDRIISRDSLDNVGIAIAEAMRDCN